jgi:hypothetical protein
MIDLTRREAITIMCAAAGAALAPNLLGAAEDPSSIAAPWYSTVQRCGAVQFNERDPLTMDISWWIDYWTSLKVEALRLNAGGIMAFYPTSIPFHHQSQFLGNRDLFGDFTKAAKAKGIRVMARLDPNLVYEDAARAHPEWIARNKNGDPLKPSNGLYATCIYSTYFTEQIPAIMREINSMYDVDGFLLTGFRRPAAPKCATAKVAVLRVSPILTRPKPTSNISRGCSRFGGSGTRPQSGAIPLQLDTAGGGGAPWGHASLSVHGGARIACRIRRTGHFSPQGIPVAGHGSTAPCGRRRSSDRRVLQEGGR